ncbi:putative ribosomal protein L24e/L24 superfamily [Helianthus annuus]|uniref:Putative ribosomal protein L24e-related protein n=1 Tax=Helianthus annuus TaxID=4232 RepID=A0A251TGC1_HELAN|nr:putative ribosomal protein L24e/L24 superfamily [Helianthus annuus]KAJ0512618.1 putative ribosomal protein L24e/L24 superfamily [Helianthus annuus]KAJ0520197.1 putative ribosomal protein L24e/L24 superfamily [Helianthus annuus]KAJ0528743.1 putative ribosomal protein L24e/L24 superfamily [Helianthus annuus]KAJ0695661.1 putative ribosomal protein L24e/L24 superfamily [Helianthus annuus]
MLDFRFFLRCYLVIMFNFTFTLVVVIGLSYADSVARRFTLVGVLDSSEDLIHRCFLFANSKCKRYFHNKQLKPSKLTWTAMYRKQHKKDLAQEAVKKRRRATKKPYSRLLWELLWKLFRRREVRNLKSVMLLFGMDVVLCFSCS